MKRKLLATLLALCLIVGMIPVAASADNAGPWVVEFVSGSPMSYSTFDEAFSAVKSHDGYPGIVYTILLTEDTEESITIKDNESAVLNIDGGVTLTNTEGQHTITVEHGGSLLVEGRGKIDNTSHAKGAVYNNGYTELRGDVILDRSQENGSDDATSGGNSWYTICNHGEMVISENVTVTTTGGGENLSTKGRYSSLIENGYQKYNSGNESSGYVKGTNYEYPSLTINGGNFSGGLNTIKNDDHGIVQINNGSFGNYYQCVVMNHHKATVTGGTFTAAEGSDKTTYGVYNCACAEDHDIGELKISGGTFTGADFAVADVSSVGGKITISNGTFIGSSGAIGISSGHTGVFSISGGTFSSNVSAYLADGYTMVESDDEYVVEPLGPGNSVAQVGENYFDSLEDAISKAESGDTVVLLKSTTGNGNIYISDGREITLNLNGFDVGFAQNGKINLTHGILNLMGRGMLYEEKPYYAPVMLYGAETDQADYTVITVGEDVILQGWSGLFVDYNKAQKAYGVKATVYGTLNSVRDYTGAGGHAFYINGTIKDTEGNVPEFILDGATLNTEDGNGMYLAGYAKTTITDSTIISNSEDSTGIEIRAGELEITNSTIIGGNGEYTGAPNGNGSTSFNVALAVTQHTTKLPIKITVNSGTFSANAAFVQANPQKNGQEDIDKVTLEINGGDFNGLVYSENKTRFISGGNFTSDPSEYLADDLAAVPSDVAGYAFTVGQAADTDVAPAVGSPNVELGEEIKENDRDAVTDVAESVKVNGGELTAAANSVLEQVTGEQITAAESAIRADGSGVAVGDDDTVTVYAQTYLDITPTSYDSEDGTLTMDITPMYRVVATTADSADDIKVIGETEDTPNAVVLDGSEEELDIQTMTITLTLPTDFVYANGTVYIQHKG